MTDVLVLGAGVIGLSCAWRAARDGHTVTVLDPAPSSGASWVAGGMLAPVTEAWPGEEELLELGVESVRRWPAFAESRRPPRLAPPAAGAEPRTRRGAEATARHGEFGARPRTGREAENPARPHNLCTPPCGREPD